MSLSNNIETYRDIEGYLNQALMAGGLRLTLPSAGSAIRWRQRAYNFRKLYREIMMETWGNASRPEDRAKAGKSPWDGWVVRAVENIITIEFEIDPVMSVETLDGEPVAVERELTPTMALDIATGPAAPVGIPSLVETHGFTEENAQAARDELNRLLRGE